MMKIRATYGAMAFAILCSTLAVADTPRLTTGSVVTSGAMRSLPISSIVDARSTTAGGSVTLALRADGTWTGLGSDGSRLLTDMPRLVERVAIGNAHGIAILPGSQSIALWGERDGFASANGDTIPTAPPGALTWAGVAAGGSHTAAWTDAGRLILAGRDDFRQCSGVPDPASVAAWNVVALGGSHTIASRAGAVEAWGLNSSGQTAVPSDARLSAGVRALAGGLMHSAAVTADGSLIGWGSNSRGQIGFPSSVPTSASEEWIDVKAGAMHTVALRADGLARAWGDDTYGQCSIDGVGNRSRTGAREIAVGLYHTAIAAPRPDDASKVRIDCFGVNFYGETGTPEGGLIDVACGDGFVVALRANHTITVWGSQTDGIRTPPGGIYATCAAGARHAAVIGAQGELRMWGDASDGKTSAPAVGAGESWVRVACGTRHTVGLLSSGRVSAWGSNAAGQTSVPSGLTATSIAAGAYFSAAVRSSGQAAVWGSNAQGQLNPPNRSDLASIAAGSDHCVALTSTGALVAWGSNGRGQCSVPDLPPGTAAQFVAANGSMSACLLTDGTVRTWGSMRLLNGDYVPTPAVDLPNVTAEGRPLRVHRLSLGGECLATLVGHEFVADYRNGPYYTIQDAIDAAPIGATVRVAAGRWFPRQIRADMTGLELKGDITLTAENPDAMNDAARGTQLFGRVWVAGNPLDDYTSLSSSIITCWNNESPACVIRGFRFLYGQRGRIWPSNPASVVGGVMYIGNKEIERTNCGYSELIGSSPTIERCSFEYGFAGYGAAIFITRSRSTIRDCQFLFNRSQTAGGAIYTWAHDGVISGCTFQNNTAADADGGALALHTIGDAFSWCNSNCSWRVSCEYVSEGCTRRFDRGATVLKDCTFTGNSAHTYGGAVSLNIGYRAPDATGPDGNPVRQAQMENCRVTSNSAPEGGGGVCIGLEKRLSDPRSECPFVEHTGIELKNTTVTGNSSSGLGAARYRDIMGPIVNQSGNTLGFVGNPCPTDLDGSGTIDHGDLAIVMMLLGTWNTGDFDDSGVVDFGDVVYLLLNFGPCV